MLIFMPPALEFPWNLGEPTRCYVGACVDEQRPPPKFDWTIIPKDRPLVYCSFGSMRIASRFRTKLYRHIIEAFARMPEYCLVLQGSINSDVPALPSNIVHFNEFVPQLEILERASLFITHGGASSLREAVYQGCPLLVIPLWMDQFGNAARVVYHGLGEQMARRSLTAENVRQAVARILTTTTYRAACAAIQTRIRAEADSAGVAFLERYIGEMKRSELHRGEADQRDARGGSRASTGHTLTSPAVRLHKSSSDN
jgi:MGT family glycosyltransferase